MKLLLPLARQEFLDPVAPDEEFVAVTPDRVGGVGLRDLCRVERVPRILGGLDFCQRRLARERRKGRPRGRLLA